MKVNATELKLRLGKYLDASETESVIIEKSGRPKSVLISYKDYQQLMAMEDYYWACRAKEAEKSGYVGSENFMNELKSV